MSKIVNVGIDCNISFMGQLLALECKDFLKLRSRIFKIKIMNLGVAFDISFMGSLRGIIRIWTLGSDKPNILKITFQNFRNSERYQWQTNDFF